MEEKTPKIVNKIDRLEDLLKTCNNHEKPNAKARKELQQLISTSAECKEAMQRQEGMYPIVLRARIEGTNSSDSFKEVMYVKCAQLREGLGHKTANQLEKLAIDQIILCWFNYHQTELQHASILSKSHSIETGIYWEKRLAFAIRRYTRALELLSKMRKMNLVVQVNNAQNQIINNE